MIFDTKFDNLLWYILKSDKQNREIILDMIGSIPQELNSEIKQAISKYRECKIINKEYNEIKKAIRISDNSICGFKLLKNGTLQLMKATLDSKKDVVKTTLDLSSNNDLYEFGEDNPLYAYFGELNITTIEKDEWNPKGYEVENETTYGIVKGLTGNYIIKQYHDKKGFKSKTKRVITRKIPTDINTDNLETFKPKKLSKTK